MPSAANVMARNTRMKASNVSTFCAMNSDPAQNARAYDEMATNCLKPEPTP